MKHRLLISLPTLCLALAAAAPAQAQLARLDKTTLIEGLRKEGMGELLKHLALTELSDAKSDPVLPKQILINQNLIDYAQKRAAALKETDGQRAAQLRKEALEAFEQAQASRLALIKEQANNEQRPLWQTDLAEQAIFEYLQVIRDNANDFYELGVPSAEQKAAFESTILQVIEATSDADVRLFVLQGDLPKEKDHTEKRVNTGLWDRMMNQYYKTRTPYFLAHAAFYASVLPDTHAYFTTTNPKIIQQRKTARDERTRLLSLVVERLEPFIKDINDPYEVRRPALALTARALLALGRVDESLAMIETVLKTSAADRTDLVTRIAKAGALEAKGQGVAAVALLEELKNHALVKENLLFRLLLVDASHRLLLRRSEKVQGKDRANLVAAAYEPYQKLLDDPALGEAAESLKDFIYRRWEANTKAETAAEFDTLPAAVAAAIAEIHRSKGQGLMEQAATDPAKAKDLAAQGKVKLDKTILICSGLLKREDLRPPVRAQAKFNLAVSYYLQDPTDNQKLIKCAGILTELGDELPDQKLAETGIINAVSMLRYLHEQPKRMSGSDLAYERAATVLLRHYSDTQAARDERLYFGSAVLEASGRFEAAAEVFAGVPSDHGDYFPAQQAMLGCLQVLYRQAKGLVSAPIDPASTQPAATQAATAPAQSQPAKVAAAPAKPALTATQLAQRLAAECARVRDEAERFVTQASADQARLARRASGAATIILADLAVDEEKRYDKALTILKDFDRDQAGEPDLMRPMLEKRIIALFQVNQFDDAVNESMRMMNAFPDDAAPVVDRVLTGLDTLMEQLRRAAGGTLVDREKKALLDRADAIVKIEFKLADLLYKWAQEQKFSDERMLPFKMVYAKSLRLAGDPRKALEILAPLQAKASNNADLLHNLAECHFAVGGEKVLLDQAAPLYDRLISDLPPEEDGKYPQLWWNAWMRRLQISEITKQGVEQIAMRVRQLQNTDSNLGGEATRLELLRLRNKWAGTLAPGANK